MTRPASTQDRQCQPAIKPVSCHCAPDKESSEQKEHARIREWREYYSSCLDATSLVCWHRAEHHTQKNRQESRGRNRNRLSDPPNNGQQHYRCKSMRFVRKRTRIHQEEPTREYDGP